MQGDWIVSSWAVATLAAAAQPLAVKAFPL